MPNRHNPNRRRRPSLRLRGWDYAAPGAYFVTICTHQRECIFDHAPFRDVAENAWRRIPAHPHAQHVALDEWVLMPNHLHGILIIHADGDGDERGGECRGEAAGSERSCSREISFPAASPLRRRPPQQPPSQPAGAPPGSVGAIVGNYKSLVTRRINNLRRSPGARVWQRGYYDRIVRNERELNAVRRYIRDNPARWAEDRDNLDTLVSRMRPVR